MIDESLLKVQMPSRYLGNEVNTVHKNWNETKLHVALAFPDLYEIGTSHFGIQILYNILNNRDNTLAERVFAPAGDMEKKIRSSKIGLQSLESKTPLRHFDIIGFSLLYELNYTNVLNMLSLSNISFMTAKRGNQCPLLIAGGPCAFNPEPIADFFDAVVIGDGEKTVIEMANVWDIWSEGDGCDKDKLLEEWIKIKGVYVPSFFKPLYNSNGNQKLIPKYANYLKVEKAIVADLSEVPLSSKPIVPFGRPVHDKLKIELSRGCTRGCRFCQAGMIYRPVRERSLKDILELVAEAMVTTGYEELSLLSLSTGDYCCILSLMEELIRYGIENNIAVSLPSLRAETLTPDIMVLVKKIRKTGFTIAPEAGSQRLRDVINKNILEEDIIKTVSAAFSLGWRVVKLYFMVGLPTESQDDVQSIVDLVKKLNLLKNKFNKNGKINVSVTTFVPKAHTPFQWMKQNTLGVSKTKIDWLKKHFKNVPGVHFKWQDPHVSFVEGILARGDRRSAHLLIRAYEGGCKFDGWSEHFNFYAWEKALEESKRASDMTLADYSDPSVILPWEHIITGVSKDFFLQELRKSEVQSTTKDCRYDKCQCCGVCDFELVRPILCPKTNEIRIKRSWSILDKQENKTYKKIKVVFSKLGTGRYFGHLEMVKIFHRSLRRAKVPIKYSKGFHPAPKVSFSDALPVGMGSRSELMTIAVPSSFKVNMLKEKLNEQLPFGLSVLECYLDTNKMGLLRTTDKEYLIELKTALFSQDKVDCFFSKKNDELSVRNRKGKKIRYNLRQIVKAIKVYNKKTAKLLISTKNGSTLRPEPILRFIFELNEGQLDSAKVTKL